ncbi:MAG: pantetheine-phosphate adenylyltransferase [Clostridia bacterium]|nr:pantetheine-phosphate adenylyltransferase [Clostridia bacterium]
MRAALIPGSFDPITVGHLDVIRRAASIFDEVYVAVMTNDMTKYVSTATAKSYMFSMNERREMAVLACADIPNVRVVESDGMLIDLVDELGVCAVVKGVRNEGDFAYEQKHALWNRAHNPKAETLYLPADPTLDGISSTIARERIRNCGDLSGILPTAVIEYIEKLN